MTQSAGFHIDMKTTDNNDKTSIQDFESIRRDETKTFKPKTWWERLQQYNDRVHEIELGPMLARKN